MSLLNYKKLTIFSNINFSMQLNSDKVILVNNTLDLKSNIADSMIKGKS